MYSSESEESDNDTKRINFNGLLYARHHKYKWENLEFDALEKNLACVFHDSLIDINEQKIFNLWEQDFDINKKAHIFDSLDFHNVYNGKCIPFLLKIENCCMTVTKGNHLATIK